MSSSSRALDRIGVIFDEPTLVADAGLIVPATLMVRLGLEAIVNRMLRLHRSRRRIASGTQGADARCGDPCRCEPHRPRRQAARRRDAEGLAVQGDGAFHARHLPSRLHLRTRPPARRGDRRGDPARLALRGGTGQRADDARRGLDDLSRSTATTSKAPPTATRRCSVITRCSQRAPTPARCCTRGCARARPSAARSVSSKNSSPASAAAGPTERSPCAPTPGSSPTH